MSSWKGYREGNVFTGIIESTGTIVSRQAFGRGLVLEIDTALDLSADAPGDSVSIDGVCLTITEKKGGVFKAVASAETVSRTTLKEARPGTRVNVERALRLGSRLGGHIVLGHVDAVGTVLSRETEGESVRMRVGYDPAFSRYLVSKGSIAVDGVSLTVNEVVPEAFEVNIIPHTAASTSLTGKHTGVRVNLEFDILGKYVENLLKRSGAGGLEALLAQSGFLERK